VRRAFLLSLALLGSATPICAQGPADTVEQRLARLEHDMGIVQDREQIEKLTRSFSYYGDKGLWDQVVDLFATDSRVEIAGRGVYYGKDGARRLFLNAIGAGKTGFAPGRLANHMMLQGIVDVAPDGLTAKGRWREFVQVGQYTKMAVWAEGVVQMLYVKENGVWKFKDMQWFASFYAPYDQGWGKAASPNNGPSTTFPPDASPSVDYDVYPGTYVVPFHYPNPVSGQVWTDADTRKYATHGLSPPPRKPDGAAPPAATAK
jgi:hypothetical protein